MRKGIVYGLKRIDGKGGRRSLFLMSAGYLTNGFVFRIMYSIIEDMDSPYPRGNDEERDGIVTTSGSEFGTVRAEGDKCGTDHPGVVSRPRRHRLRAVIVLSGDACRT